MSERRELRSWTKPIVWGIAFGLFQAFSPFAFFWLEPFVIWSMPVPLIAAVYIGLAVADGRASALRTPESHGLNLSILAARA